jgi:hypothetical protein
MNLRHAAALALVGWYLIAPPIRSGTSPDDQVVDDRAPLSAWIIVDSFDAASDCQRTMKGTQSFHLKSFHDVEGLTEDQRRSARKQLKDMENAMQCIASDDPRLKEAK